MRLHLIDGTYELFRAHYSKRPDRTDHDGRDVKGTAGFVSSILGLLAEEEVTHVAVAFDNPIESFRNERFPGYKDSSGVDQAILDQFDLVEDAAAALGLVVWSMGELEADDALGAAAVRFVDAVDQVRIATADKDLAQVVDGDRIVQLDRRGDRVIDEAAVVERFGVGPASIPDYLALVGDSADGIPGLPGFGAKTASGLLAVYGHIEDIPRDGAQWQADVRGAQRLAETLRERRDDALLYRELATLVTDWEPPQDLEALAWDGVPRAEYLEMCDRLNVGALRERPHRWQG